MTVHPRVAVVRWNDAHGSATTAYAMHEIPHAPVVIDTLGWILRDDDAGVSIANEHCGDGDYRGVTFIPRGMVVYIRYRGGIPRPKAKKRPARGEVVEEGAEAAGFAEVPGRDKPSLTDAPRKVKL